MEYFDDDWLRQVFKDREFLDFIKQPAPFKGKIPKISLPYSQTFLDEIYVSFMLNVIQDWDLSILKALQHNGILTPEIIDSEYNRLFPSKPEIESKSEELNSFSYGHQTFTEYDPKQFITEQEINYEQLDESLFKEKGYEVQVNEIKSDSKYLTQDILKYLKKGEKSTTVLNLGTGTGKTYAIEKYIIELLKDKQNVIILASPYRTLVDKDKRYLTERKESKISTKQVVTISEIEELKSKDNPKYFRNIAKPIQIITSHFLLGNAGKEFQSQSSIKVEYLNDLEKWCRKKHKRIFLVLDEIHDSVANFSSKHFFRLLRWNGLVQNVILASATLTKPVSVVVEHFAYLTEDRINIIRAQRRKLSKEIRSELEIIFLKEYTTTRYKDLEIIKYLMEQHKDSKNHVLSYSKDLAKKIKEVGKWMNEPYNYTVSNSSDMFNRNTNNLGTTFKTGLNILTGDNLIIIFPTSNTPSVDSVYGIFSDGIPSILQSIGRVREKGKIIFICTLPYVQIKDPSNKFFKEIYDFRVAKLEKAERELSLIKSRYDEKYELFKQYIEGYQEEVSKRKIKDRPYISPPNFTDFLLEHGQEYLVSRNYISGKLITPYLIWAAFNDQFPTCKLSKVFVAEYNYIILDISVEYPFKVLLDHVNTYIPNKDWEKLSFQESYYKVREALQQVSTEEGLKKVKIVKGKKVNRVDFVIIILQIVKIVLYKFGIVDQYYRTSKHHYTLFQLQCSWINKDLEESSLLNAYHELRIVVDEFMKKRLSEKNLYINPKFEKIEKADIEILFNKTNLNRLKKASEVINSKDTIYRRKNMGIFKKCKFDGSDNHIIYDDLVRNILPLKKINGIRFRQEKNRVKYNVLQKNKSQMLFVYNLKGIYFDF